MKKGLILLAGILVACLPGLVMAGMNPGSYGLVPVNTTLGVFPDNNYYASGLGTNVVNNNGSVLCVGCHSRNPANLAGTNKNKARTMSGSHFVTQNFNDTNRGGGYPDGRGTRNVSGTHIYMAEQPVNWAGAPKYGRLAAGAIDNDIVANAAGAVVDGAQMICYSCHSLHSNTGTSARLLANGAPQLSPLNGISGTAPFVDNAWLCISCHGDMQANIAAEWQIHPLDNTAPRNETGWGGTHHHRNSHSSDAVGTTAAYKGSITTATLANQDMGQMDSRYYGQTANAAPGSYGGTIWQLWAIDKGILGTTYSANHALGFGIPTAYPNLSRTISAAPDNGWIRPSTHASTSNAGRGTIICVDCHRGHFGDSSTAAVVLVKGGTDINNLDPTLLGATNTISDNNSSWRGVLRMSDRGGRYSTFLNGNLNPNCLACHK